MQLYKDLEIGKQWRGKTKDRSLSIIGFDTETLLTGDIFLICDSKGNYFWKPSFMDCIKFLSRHSHRQKLNFFWNLNFDVSGVIKFMCEDYQKALVAYSKVELAFGKHGKYGLQYCKDRLFVIEKHDRVAFYDLAQFYSFQSLDRASRHFLKEKKAAIPDYNFTLENVEERKEQIIEYCIQDCVLVEKLGELCQKQYERLGIYEGKYISPAFLSEKHFNKKCYIPKTLDLINTDYGDLPSPVEYAYNAYAGGWIECLERGHIEKVYRYDISSAYPWAMSDLIDPNLGKWIHSETWIPESYYSFMKCRVSIGYPPLTPSPISFRYSSGKAAMRVYPLGEWVVYLTKIEYEFINKHLGEAEVIDGWFFIPNDSPLVMPLKSQIAELYRKKQVLKKEAKKSPTLGVEYQNIKLLLNSFYGKSLQRVPIRTITDKGEIVIDHYKTGSLFNPIWGAIVTAKVRVKIAETLIGKVSTLAAVTTDGIITTEPLDLEIGTNLGDWTEEPGGEAVIVYAGAYGIKRQKVENKIRGFAGIFRDSKIKNWFDYLALHRNDKAIVVIDRRPVSLFEALQQTKKFTSRDVNRFIDFPRKYGLKEHSRHWQEQVLTCGGLLDKQFYSFPWTIRQLSSK